jgi:hypothetical protein
VRWTTVCAIRAHRWTLTFWRCFDEDLALEDVRVTFRTQESDALTLYVGPDNLDVQL